MAHIHRGGDRPSDYHLSSYLVVREGVFAHLSSVLSYLV